MNKSNPLSGAAIKTERGYFYVKNGKRMRIESKKILKSWRFGRVPKMSEESVAHLPVLGRLGFRDGTLLYCMGDAFYYIVTNNKLYKVEGPQDLRDNGLKMRDALIISKKERDIHKRLEND